MTDDIVVFVASASVPSSAAALIVSATECASNGGGGGGRRAHCDVLLHRLSGVQSESPLQVRPMPHLSLHVAPPSRQVSKAFMMPSEQVGDWQILLRHTLEVQLELSTHGLPGPHKPHEPPQSIPSSSAFLMLSVQLASEHVLFESHSDD